MLKYILLFFFFIFNHSCPLSLKRIITYFNTQDNSGQLKCIFGDDRHKVNTCSIEKDLLSEYTLVMMFSDSDFINGNLFMVYIKYELLDGVYTLKIIKQLMIKNGSWTLSDYFIEGKPLPKNDLNDVFNFAISTNVKYLQFNKRPYVRFKIEDQEKLRSSPILKEINAKEEKIFYTAYKASDFLTNIKLIMKDNYDVKTIDDIKYIYDNLMGDINYCINDGCLENTLLIYESIIKHKVLNSPLLIRIYANQGELLHGPDIKWGYHVTLVYHVLSDDKFYVVDQDKSLSKNIPTVDEFFKKFDPYLNANVVIKN